MRFHFVSFSCIFSVINNCILFDMV